MPEQEFDAAAVLAGLKRFQRATVEHVTRQFYGPSPVRRFLVADETGLGKSMVARGVIAKTIERLSADDETDRIDFVYVCSNADLARQNLARLNVTGDPLLSNSSRLTMLATRPRRSAKAARLLPKPVTMTSFTPDTSFELGRRAGKADERALLFLLIEPLLGELSDSRRLAVIDLLRGAVRDPDRFDRHYIQRLRDRLADGIDPQIADAFRAEIRDSSLLRRFEALLGEYESATAGQGAVWLADSTRELIGELRTELALVSVRALKPALVILDEFQRFGDLLETKKPAGKLASHLFADYATRVLLLSATPYKAFTYAEEAADDHYLSLLAVLKFLADGTCHLDLAEITEAMATYRPAVVSGRDVSDVVLRIRQQLLTVMCRTERPRQIADAMHAEPREMASELDVGDLTDYVGLRRLASQLGERFSVEYWKSIPYFVNFSEGYQLGRRLRRDLQAPEAAPVRRGLSGVRVLSPATLQKHQPVDFGNARLRRLAADTVAAGWWRLLWLPPSLPYLTPGGPYAEAFAAGITKRLIFSSWAGTPTAVAALLSYEADRLTAEGRLASDSPAARRALSGRLAYRLDNERPATMNQLSTFWPMPGLARIADPLRFAGGVGGAADAASAQEDVAAVLALDLPGGETTRASAAEAWYWAAALRLAGPVPEGVTAAQVLQDISRSAEQTDEDGEEYDSSSESGGHVLRKHIESALGTWSGAASPVSGPVPTDLASIVTRIAMHSPGNIAWRSLGRLIGDREGVTSAGHWRAAATLADALRTMFRRPESVLLLDRECGGQPYWQAVLQYCADGNLQAVLDEYLHHLAVDQGQQGFDGDDQLMAFAGSAAQAIALRSPPYQAFNPVPPGNPIRLRSRFAMRYGGRRQDEDGNRLGDVRHAFNSPFWPLVLATTSVGQEGIDFHWWCHGVMHWNTPANPVDFEQREGRVDRYAGHAVRRNIAHKHGMEILRSADADPWRAAYAIAADVSGDLGELAPHWVYPGPARIERHVAPYPLSVDLDRLRKVKEDLALYRLTFGQPRQEDMLELLRQRGIAQDPEHVRRLTLNLTPPPWPRESDDKELPSMQLILTIDELLVVQLPEPLPDTISIEFDDKGFGEIYSLFFHRFGRHSQMSLFPNLTLLDARTRAQQLAEKFTRLAKRLTELYELGYAINETSPEGVIHLVRDDDAFDEDDADDDSDEDEDEDEDEEDDSSED